MSPNVEKLLQCAVCAKGIQKDMLSKLQPTKHNKSVEFTNVSGYSLPESDDDKNTEFEG